jgi:CDGSH-type Zn-finger protein
MRVVSNPEDVGRCGCGRREYCDGSHGLTEAQWQARLAREDEARKLDAGTVQTETKRQQKNVS